MNPVISVILPTAGKRSSELARAIASVVAQDTRHPIEIIVADDSQPGLDERSLQSQAGAISLTVLRTYGGPLVARQAAVEAAAGDWVAFLDDDDTWHQDKLETQMKLATTMASKGERPVISCRFNHSFAESQRSIGGIPARLIRPDEHVEDYLFLGRGPDIRRPSIFTSTILAPRSVVQEVPWRRVPRHQDWDWLVRVAEARGVTFAHCAEELATIAVGSSGSISATVDWSSSLKWGLEVLSPRQNMRAYVDFLAAQPLRYSLQARDLQGVRAVMSEIKRVRRCPSAASLATGLAGIVSRRIFQKAMAASSFGQAR